MLFNMHYNLYNSPLELEEVKMPIVEDVDLFLMYVNEEEKKYAAYLAQELRLAGFIVDTDYLGRGLKAQFKQADRLNAKFTCVLNSEDLDNNEVKIKNNKTKVEDIISLDVLIYYLDEMCNTGCDCDDDCDCDETCDCGGHCHCHDEDDEHECHCQDGGECTCGDDCHCHDEDHECHCQDGGECTCGDDCHCHDEDDDHECCCGGHDKNHKCRHDK